MYHKIEKEIAEAAPEAFLTAAAIRWRVKNRNLALFKQASLAAELGVSVPTISRHLKELRQLGLIVAEPDATSAWLVHPLFAWYGDFQEKDSYWESLPHTHPFKLFPRRKKPEEG